MQHITLAEVKEACRKAYAEKRLIAQDPEAEEYGYCMNGHVCAIGAALTPKTLAYIEGELLQSCTLAENPYRLSLEVFTWDEKDLGGLVAIQQAHDRWLRFVIGEEDGSVIEAEKGFVALIAE